MQNEICIDSSQIDKSSMINYNTPGIETESKYFIAKIVKIFSLKMATAFLEIDYTHIITCDLLVSGSHTLVDGHVQQCIHRVYTLCCNNIIV